MRHRPLPRVSVPSSRRRRPAGFSLAGSFAGSMLAVTVVHALALPPFVGLQMVAVVVCLCSIDATWFAAAGVAMLGWLFLDGFVTNAFGELRVAGSRDEWWLAVLVGVAVASAAASRLALGARAAAVRPAQSTSLLEHLTSGGARGPSLPRR